MTDEQLWTKFTSPPDRFLSINWSPVLGYWFIDRRNRSIERAEKNLKSLCDAAGRRLPQDGIRERWVIFLDAVRQYDPTVKKVAYSDDHIRERDLAAARKDVEARQSQGAAPALVEYVPYVPPRDVPDSANAPMPNGIASAYEEALTKERGPLYCRKYVVVEIDDIYGACASYWLYLMTLPPPEAPPENSASAIELAAASPAEPTVVADAATGAAAPAPKNERFPTRAKWLADRLDERKRTNGRKWTKYTLEDKKARIIKQRKESWMSFQ